ncbi:hypothetical protein SPRG_01761 [Saprolegnia parasitica CBS 223.65]|uniref:ZNF598/HEL2 PAH domain-containing protein n=1 Tax=Saprolegnia parasitica (strain CBS 223.65) TaxID=695850 RepID=A0A067D586_SAPPC|nr:hypothetical protein SPRG_01761 [Saprolegnia parasitica CBS 223.65]KDO33881.1 hypothetical protein SPRG_01761 [Saprolegnia parasitica CBS 223.65]|eukprot:XP_012195517.1 hypothetical protein SPRG_01761 [Saprolegnia parasitica CBS 223.65]
MEGRPAPPGRRPKARVPVKAMDMHVEATIDAPVLPSPTLKQAVDEIEQGDGATSDASTCDDAPPDASEEEARQDAPTTEVDAPSSPSAGNANVATPVPEDDVNVAIVDVDTTVATEPTPPSYNDATDAVPAPETPIEEAPPATGSYYGLEALLAPFTSVPDVPPLESLECVYNEDAVELQKLIFRAVKMCTNKNKLKLEEFKINGRLYGNGFMEPHEYIDAIAADVGSLEVLILVPCMLRLQPDRMAKKTLWLALRAYRAMHLAALTRQIAPF